ncbi:hypothetical protein [Nonomuraea sp. CA-141351]|uniref:hypothetical protein n=1 Tax=Nonomuraea sp. CA-141351 TaxID=3239996 RepID=UPI003D8C7968
MRRIRTPREAAEEIGTVVQLPGTSPAPLDELEHDDQAGELAPVDERGPGRLERAITTLAQARERFIAAVVGESVLAEQLPSVAELWWQTWTGGGHDTKPGRVVTRVWGFAVVLPVHALGQLALWFVRYWPRALVALIVVRLMALINPMFSDVLAWLIDALATLARLLLT